MEQKGVMFKVLSPVEGKNGKTFWMRIGSAFTNRDGSTNVYLNAYPTSGKLQIRAFDERDASSQPSSYSSPPSPPYAEEAPPALGGPDEGADDLPF